MELFNCFCGQIYDRDTLETCPYCFRTCHESLNDAYDWTIIAATAAAQAEAKRKEASIPATFPFPGIQAINRPLDEQDMKILRRLFDELAKVFGEDFHGVLLKLGLGRHFSEEDRIAFVRKLEGVKI